MNKEHTHMTTHPLARRSRLIAAGTAVALAAAGAVAVPLVASATGSDSPYVTVAWAYPGYPDMTVPQPYIASTPGANLHAFDELAASGAWCGKPIQVDVYQRTDKHGVSWETLKETGALLNSHDGGFLAYNAGVGTPYRVITSEEYPCTTASPSPSPSPTTPATEPQPTSSPSTPSSSPSPTDSPTPPAPTSEPTAPASPTPSDEPTSTPTPSAPVTEPTTPVETPEPSAPGTATPPTIPVQPTPSTSPRSSQPSVAPAPAITAPDAPRDLHLPLVSG